MNTLDVVFLAWLSFLSSLSVDTEAVLNPPAGDTEIVNLERTIGFELPQELRELYKLTNGQQSPWHVEPGLGMYAVNLFGHYDFLSIQQAQEAYEFNRELYADIGNRIDDSITVRAGHPGDALTWKEGWLPIAGSGANQIAVDLSPAAGGDYGQLIPIGADEYERLVLSPSLTEFFLTAAKETGADKCSLEYGIPDASEARIPEQHRRKSNPYILYITAKWNHPFYRDNCAPTSRYEQPEYAKFANELGDKFREQLLVLGVAQDRIDAIVMVSSRHLYLMLEVDWRVDKQADFAVEGAEAANQSGEVPDLDDLANNRNTMYLSAMSFDLACRDAGLKGRPFELAEDEYRLFNRFLVDAGLWREQDYRAAEQALLELPAVEFDESNGVGFCSTR